MSSLAATRSSDSLRDIEPRRRRDHQYLVKRPDGVPPENRPMRTRLVERARDGDDSAFAELVDLDGDLCYAIAYRILRDVERAQDAVQQAFLLAWRELPRLRD